jgi:hypothetical protein
VRGVWGGGGRGVGAQRGQSLEIIIFYCNPKYLTLSYVKGQINLGMCAKVVRWSSFSVEWQDGNMQI